MNDLGAIKIIKKITACKIILGINIRLAFSYYDITHLPTGCEISPKSDKEIKYFIIFRTKLVLKKMYWK